MIVLENDLLKISINEIGAELRSVMNKSQNFEYMWSADPSVWPRVSPVLFPIVGRLKNDTYYHNDQAYSLSQHGFARNMLFDVIHQSNTDVHFELKANEETKKNYPFDFTLQLKYSLQENNLSLQYEVLNNSSDVMYFSIGMHPGFKVPFMEHEAYDDYYIECNEVENASRYLISGGLISDSQEKVFDGSKTLALHKELFDRDALVFKNLASSEVSIKSKNHSHGITLEAKDFPYYGIWAQPKANFVCLEPWCGIADGVNSDQQLKNKEGIQQLGLSEIFFREVFFRFF
jgi:galactose mutarotase-like enzyme